MSTRRSHMKRETLCMFYEWPVEFVSSENIKSDVPKSCASINFRKSRRPAWPRSGHCHLHSRTSPSGRICSSNLRTQRIIFQQKFLFEKSYNVLPRVNFSTIHSGCSLFYFGRCADFGRNAVITSVLVSIYGPPIRSMQ